MTTINTTTNTSSARAGDNGTKSTHMSRPERRNIGAYVQDQPFHEQSHSVADVAETESTRDVVWGAGVLCAAANAIEAMEDPGQSRWYGAEVARSRPCRKFRLHRNSHIGAISLQASPETSLKSSITDAAITHLSMVSTDLQRFALAMWQLDPHHLCIHGILLGARKMTSPCKDVCRGRDGRAGGGATGAGARRRGCRRCKRAASRQSVPAWQQHPRQQITIAPHA